MSADQGRPQLDHPGLAEAPPGATPIDEMAATDLTDQQKLAVVLQGAALLAHATSWRRVFGEADAPFRGAAVDREGRLFVGPARPGRFPACTQQLLSWLLRRLFHSPGQIAGRGVARRAARLLLTQWSQELVPLSAGRAISQIFEAAPFLWEPAWASARQALAARLRRPGDERHYLLFAGPGGARRRFERAAPTLESAWALLAGDPARDLFEGVDASSDPLALEDSGQPLRAALAWRRRPPREDHEKQRCARLLLGLGRGHSAAVALEGLATPAARLLRARALLDAGDRHSAEKALQFEASLFPKLALDRLDLEVQLLGGRGENEAIRRKVAALLAAFAGRPEAPGLRCEAYLIAAAAAWDCGDRQATAGYLEAARDAADDPELAPRYYQQQALAAQAVGDGLRATAASQAALRARRRLPRAQAGRLWSDLAVSRVMAGDLAGAERAARHAWLLLEGSEGDRPLSLALSNLAEVRLRRGRFAGVEATLERSIAQHRLAANWRALLHDLETMTRLELGLGRPAAALARVAEALGQVEAAAARQDVFQLFAARAHGWLARPREAAACLDLGGAAALGELEPEERPAILALAGRGEEAQREAHGTPWQDLWRALAVGVHPPYEAWLALESLEPYRAARLIFDAERLVPGVAPRQHLRRALATLRAAGAEAMAEQIDTASRSLASALTAYAGRARLDSESAHRLLEQAGYGEAALAFRLPSGAIEPLAGHWPAAAAASPALRELPCAGGQLLLAGGADEPALEALFALLRRDLEPQLASFVATLAAAPAPAPRSTDTGEMPYAVDGIIGRAPALIAAVRRLDALASAEFSVLIHGESGCGKELFARRLHRRSSRAQGPFLAVNCAAMNESLILSDLFGHVRGGFTGADRDRAGIFESARGGTVFLDEIGDLPLSCQGHLLRVLQESEIRRVGESFARKVDVRVITATHRDLEAESSAGRFRLDLLFRLRAAHVFLPPLRQRRDDLPVLAAHFLARLPPPKKALRLSREAQLVLARHDWPGNIRELKNVVEVAAALAEGPEITVADLELPEAASAEIPANTGDAVSDYHQQIEAFRRDLVRRALAESQGHRSEAARRLGLSRQALSYLIRQLGLL